MDLADAPAVFWGTGLMKAPPWAASRCYSCNNYSIWLDQQLAFPDPRLSLDEPVSEPHEDMPADAAALFNEAVAVLPFSRRAATALSRASMERLVRTLDPECPPRTRLDERLVRLEGRVSSPTMQLLNVLRHAGNTALHGGQDGDESVTIYMNEDRGAIVETFFHAINALVDELVTRPRLSDALYNELPESVREAYERKARGQGGGNPSSVRTQDRSS